MTPQALKQLDSRLANFLQELTEPMGRSERRHWARVYLEGLLLDGERKSVEPMAARIPGAEVQALRQFLSQSPWEVAEVQRRLALKVVDTLKEPELWILDETSFPKAGNHSVGVARQYCGRLGETENCQTAVSLSVATATGSLPIAWRLYRRRSGPTTQCGARRSRYPSRCGFRPSRRLRWRRFGKRWRTGCRPGWCWPMKCTDPAASSGMAWEN